MASRGNVVAGWEFLHHLDIGGETSTGEDALEQIMAEQGRVRHPAGKRRFESVDFIDALAGIGAFADQILVHVGCGGGIRVDAVHAGKDTLEQRAFAADRQRWRDARLQHGIARQHPAGGNVECGRLSGCAILPIRRCTVSRGSRVSASSVMT